MKDEQLQMLQRYMNNTQDAAQLALELLYDKNPAINIDSLCNPADHCS
jgi:hypothetical protein